MKSLLLLLPVLLLLALAHIRFAASDPALWHVDPETAADPGTAGVLRRQHVAGASGDVLAAFDAIVMASPRVTRLAGSLDQGHLTYVARSKWIGFPDYVTVKVLPDGQDSELVVLSRLRFGTSDLGVNAARLENWLYRLQSLQQ